MGLCFQALGQIAAAMAAELVDEQALEVEVEEAEVQADGGGNPKALGSDAEEDELEDASDGEDFVMSDASGEDGEDEAGGGVDAEGLPKKKKRRRQILPDAEDYALVEEAGGGRPVRQLQPHAWARRRRGVAARAC